MAFANENCIKKTMYENNIMEDMRMKLTIVQCTVPEGAVILN